RRPPNRARLPRNRAPLPPNRGALPLFGATLPPNRGAPPPDRARLPPNRGGLPLFGASLPLTFSAAISSSPVSCLDHGGARDAQNLVRGTGIRLAAARRQRGEVRRRASGH